MSTIQPKKGNHFHNDKADKHSEEEYKHVVEVRFQEGSKVGDCFESALKAWRIYQPNAINAED
jgi:hypothetical protein